MSPRFSVVIPLYNKRAHIERALNSVFAQTVGDFELLVIDDGSTDGGEEIVKACVDPRLRLVSQANQGVSAARNLGVALATAPYVAFLDADDEWRPHFLAEIEQLICASPDSTIFATAYEKVSPDGRSRQSSVHGIQHAIVGGIFLDFLDCVGRDVHPFYTSSVCVSRAAFMAVGGFDRSLQIGEDEYMWLSLSLRSPACFSHKVSATYYLDAENRALNQTGRSEKFLGFVRKLINTASNEALSEKQRKDLKGLISLNLYRSLITLLRSGEKDRARLLMSDFSAFLMPRHKRRIGRKQLKYALLGPVLYLWKKRPSDMTSRRKLVRMKR